MNNTDKGMNGDSWQSFAQLTLFLYTLYGKNLYFTVHLVQASHTWYIIVHGFLSFYNKVQLWHTEKRVGCFWGWGKCLGVGDGWWIAVEFCLFSFLSFLLLSMLSRLASILATFSKYSLIYLHLKAKKLLGDDGGKRSMR